MSYGGFKPSEAAKLLDLSSVDSFRPEGDLGRYNTGYRTEAQSETAIAPFLAANKARDEQRRNYVIRAGGKLEYKSDPTEVTSVEMDDQHKVFGHNSRVSDNIW